MTEKAANTPNAAALPEKKKKKGGYIFPIGITILSCICIPYAYYAILINAHGHAHKPADYHMPEYRELWKTLVGAIVCFVVRKLVFFLFYPIAYRICRVQDKDNDEELRNIYTVKACNSLFGVLYFTVSTYWGWSVLKDCPMLPWYLGGPADAYFGKTQLHTIYLDYSP